MPRRDGPALYELLGSKGQPDGERPQPSQRLSPADLRAILLVVAFFAVLAAGYFVGHARGVKVGRAEAIEDRAVGAPDADIASASRAEQGAMGTAAPGTEGGARPAANATSGQGATGTPENLTRNGIPTAQAPVLARPVLPPDGDLGPMPEALDPRQSGLQYFVLCSTLESNALKVVAFCRLRGLDAYVVPDQNGRLREVTVLPGFGASERSSSVIRELEERIRRVGVLWKASGPGNSDFGDRYIKTHRQ